MRGFVLAVGAKDFWATSFDKMSEPEREKFALSAWRIEMYHRGLKQQCLIEQGAMPPVAPRVESHWVMHSGICAP